MNFIMQHRWGHDERSSKPEALGDLLAELDAREPDGEHTSVSVRLPSGWCLGAYLNGLVIFENVEDLAIKPRHVCVDTKAAARTLMELLVCGNFVALEQQSWQPGYGV